MSCCCTTRPESYTIQLLARDSAAVLRHCGWWMSPKSTHIAGISLGGMIAQELFILDPSRFASLTILASHAGRPQQPQLCPSIPHRSKPEALPTSNSTSSTDSTIINKDTPPSSANSSIKPPPRYINEDLSQVARMLVSEDGIESHGGIEVVAERLRRIKSLGLGECPIGTEKAEQIQRGIQGHTNAVRSHDVITGARLTQAARHSQLWAKVIIVGGTADSIVTWDRVNHLASLVPGCCLIPAKGAGHLLHYECATLVNNILMHQSP
ncbi:hypothetical protein Pelo_16005 [Pelomyxa schiedti]|nr:hypothetical protein Pelo_16005 [Pelomyxa schiedti]